MASKHPKNIHDEFALVERFVDTIIPYLVVLLALLIILDFTTDIHQFEPWISYADWLIIGFFITDLVFKWFHVRKFTQFVKLYWLDILAVFPFYLVLRTYFFIAELVAFGERVSEAQQIAHEAVLLREAKIIKESEIFTKESKLLREAELIAKEGSRASRLVRLAQRFVRFIYAGLHLTLYHTLTTSRKHQHESARYITRTR